MIFISKNIASPTGLKRFWCLSQIAIPKVSSFFLSDITYYKHNYSAELETAINKQVQAEQQAAQDYLNLAIALLHPSVSRLGAGGFFMRMYHEELEHMEKFINYQLLRGGTPIIDGLRAPTPKPKISFIDAFKQAINIEHCVTELIEQLVSTAAKDKDYHCVNYVTTVFLQEQMNSIHKLSLHVTELASIGEDPEALHQYDLLLLNTYPYKLDLVKN